MITKLYLIGIGPGDPKYLTLEASDLIQKLNLFFVPDKSGKKEILTEMRLNLIKTVKGNDDFKIVGLTFPERRKGPNYREKVKEWRREKARILKRALLDSEESEAGFLIWGDPSLFDGHIDIMREVEKDLPIKWEVIPGLSSFQVLSAKQKISLTEVSTSLAFHTPRSLRNLERISHPVLVFLDNYETFQKFKDDENVTIHWGAFVGTEREVLFSGRLSEIYEKLKSLRRKIRKEVGVIMEIYYMKRGDENSTKT